MPTLASRVFDTLLRDAAWQSALDECFERNHAQPTHHFNRRVNPAFVCAGFPDAIASIANRTSVTRCNFDLGAPWDVAEVVRGKQAWSHDDWSGAWLVGRVDNAWHIFSPLPDAWIEFLRESIIPEEEFIPHPPAD
jgi:hypothetical protein